MEELPRHRLSENELHQALRTLPGWAAQQDKLCKQFEFKDFVEAFGFMTSVALIAEAMIHHPEWSNVYNRVEFTLWTHTHSGITNLDADLAQKIEALAKARHQTLS